MDLHSFKGGGGGGGGVMVSFVMLELLWGMEGTFFCF